MGYMSEEQAQARMRDLNELIAAGWGGYPADMIPRDWRTRRPKTPSPPVRQIRGRSPAAAREAARVLRILGGSR